MQFPVSLQLASCFVNLISLLIIITEFTFDIEHVAMSTTADDYLI